MAKPNRIAANIATGGSDNRVKGFNFSSQQSCYGLDAAACRQLSSTLTARRQTTEPILNMGIYMAITNPPIKVPNITMIKGSIKLANAATVSSTSAS